MEITTSDIHGKMQGNEETLERVARQRKNIVEYVKTWVISKLKSQGFDIHINYPMLGEGRVSHVFDIVAELSPLPNAVFRAGIVLLSNDVVVDVIERYIAWKSEFPLDKIIIIALGNVESEAFDLAKRYNIDIVRPVEDLDINENMLKEWKFYKEYHVEPIIGLKEVEHIFKSKISKTSILRRNKSKILYYALVYVPLIVLDIHVAEKDTVREEVSIIEKKLVFDGLEGYAVVSEGSSIGIDEVLGKFSDLSIEALTVLKRVAEEGTVAISDIEESLSISKEKLRTIFGRLSNKSLLDIFGDIVEIRYSILNKFVDPLSLAKSKKAPVHQGVPAESKGEILLPPKVCITRFIDLVDALNGKTENVYVVYYPFFVGVRSENGEKSLKLIILDGVALEEQNSFYKIFSSLDILEKIREKGLEASPTH